MPPVYKHTASLGLNAPMPSINIPPLWGFGCLLIVAFYKHVAPLGLEGRGMPPVYKHTAPLGLNAPMPSIHMSPLWGLGGKGDAALYKHAAPLGLNAESNLLSTLGLCLGFSSV